MWNMEYVVLKGEKLKEDCMTNEFVRMGAWQLTMQIAKSFFNKKSELLAHPSLIQLRAHKR